MRQRLFLALSVVFALGFSLEVESQDGIVRGKAYRIVDGAFDSRTYDGFRRYHAACSHCHGPDGLGSMFAGSLVEQIPDIETFRYVVLTGVRRDAGIMKGFAQDPNIAPYIDDIYAYLQARADGVLPRGRPDKVINK
jgi:mono/diheme cytochrome c family protein